MNDPLKKYVSDHRDEFDHLSPSPEVFLKLKSRLTIQKAQKTKGLIRLLVAASILIIGSASYLILTQPETKSNHTVPQYAKKDTQEHTPVTASNATVNHEKLNGPEKIERKPEGKRLKINKVDTDILTAYRNLTDSTSASTRLSAILQIQKSSLINYDIVDKLAKTLSFDPNTNVRLAALNLLSKYVEDGYVANAFMSSLSHQKDPIVQLGLIELLSQIDNPKLDDKLYALANDPNTLSEVKDQAYFVLLNQNKL